jgi:hypothetical protein
MNKNFVIYNAQGQILRTGYCPDEDFGLQAMKGELITEATACCANDAVNPETGEIIHGGNLNPPGVPTPSEAPPSSGLSAATQLDLLWQAMDAGTFPKAEPFYSAIKAQKEAAL